MSKHLADHRAAPSGERVKAFVTIARRGSGHVWQALWKRPVERAFPQGLPDLPATLARNGDKGFDPLPAGCGAMVGKMLGHGRLP